MATIPQPSAINYPTVDELRSMWLDQVRYSQSLKGISVNVSEGSDLWARADASARVAMLALQNGRIGLRNLNPLVATGDHLLEYCNVFGVSARSASKAIGLVTITITNPNVSSVTIPTGFVCTHAVTGIKYEVVLGAVVSNGGTIQIRAKSAGANTDADAGDIVTWDSASVGSLKQQAVVAAGGIDGGYDADDEETLRQRLLRRLGLPAVGGNAAHTAQLSEDASAAVRVAFVYPSLRGPASYDVAILGTADDPVLNASVQTEVEDYVAGEKPGETSANVTSVVLEELDVVADIRLPLPKAVGGLGGGWKDSNPWPSDAESGVKAKITGKTTTPSTVYFTVDSTSADAPSVGRRCAVWDPVSEAFVEFAIVAVSGSSGSYLIETDLQPNAVDNITTGMFVSPAAVFLDDYAQTFIAAMADMGPGEKTANQDILRYARRFPSTSFDYPAALTSRQLGAIETAHTEIEGTSFAARYETGTTTTRTEPSVPATTTEAPRLLTLANLAFRRAT